jgi:ribonuclease P protein component
MRVWVVPNGLEHARVGVAVGRRQGGAVQRNHLKRMVREAARLCLSEFPPGLDIICAPRPSPPLTLRACRESLVRLARQAARSVDGPQEPVH